MYIDTLNRELTGSSNSVLFVGSVKFIICCSLAIGGQPNRLSDCASMDGLWRVNAVELLGERPNQVLLLPGLGSTDTVGCLTLSCERRIPRRDGVFRFF